MNFDEIMTVVDSAVNKKETIVQFGKIVRADLEQEQKNREFVTALNVERLFKYGRDEDKHNFYIYRDIYEQEHLFVVCHGGSDGICAAQKEGINVSTIDKITVVCCYGGYNSDTVMVTRHKEIQVRFFNRTKRALWDRFVCYSGNVGELHICIDTPKCEELRQLREKLLTMYYSL